MQEMGLRSASGRRLLANSFRRFVVLGLCGEFPLDDCAGREILCIGGLCSERLKLGEECHSDAECEDSNPCEKKCENDENATSICRYNFRKQMRERLNVSECDMRY
jgi:hypothetical protein